MKSNKPYGYHPGEAEILTRIRELLDLHYRNARRNYSKVARDLNAENLPTRTGVPWSGAKVYRAVRKHKKAGRPPKNISGKRFGRLVVIKLHPVRDESGHARWVCVCDCGKKTIIRGISLRQGDTRSCGCLNVEMVIARGHLRKGIRIKEFRKGDHPLYETWHAMKTNCRSNKGKRYRLYRSRGITVCDRWCKSFDAFIEDVGERPAGMFLCRINKDGNFEPKNCRWENSKRPRRQ